MGAHRFRDGLVLIAITCALVACDSGPVASSHRPSNPSFGFDSQRVLLELNQTWSQTGPDSGGFGNVYSLESAPSLYETAWHLKVAATIGAPLPNLSRTEAAGWLTAELAQQPVDGLHELQRINLTVAALKALHSPIPPSAVDAVARLRSGQLYSLDPGGRASWSATALAVLTLQDAAAPIPSDLAGPVLQELPAATAANDPSSWAEVLLPVWTLADLLASPSERAGQRSRLGISLHAILDTIKATSLGEQAMFLLAQVNDIARSNGLTDAITTADVAQPLVTTAGYLVAGASDPRPSMANTFYALTMGYAPAGSSARQVLSGYMDWSAGPRGWRNDVGQPEPTTSFYSWEVYRALGVTGPEELLRKQVVAWLAQSAAARTWRDLGRQDHAYFLFLLARSLGVTVPSSIQDLVAAELASSDTRLDGPEGVALARESVALDLPAGAFVQGQWRSTLSTFKLDTLRSTDSAITLAQALRDPTTIASLKSRLQSMHPEVLWHSGAGMSSSDLIAAAIQTKIDGLSEPTATAVRHTFLDQRGYWLLPISQAQNNVVEPMTLYLGLWMTGAGVDGGGVIL